MSVRRGPFHRVDHQHFAADAGLGRCKAQPILRPVTRARTFIARFAAGGALLLTGFLVYMYVESRATAEARLALRSDATVRVTVRPQDALFEPAAVPRAAAGLLFLPGTPVDPIAYAPVARAIAARGYATAIVYLPRRGLASAESRLLATRAGEAMRALGAERWVIAGHSRGGEFGSRLVLDNPGRYAALVLIATTHPRSFSLAAAPVDDRDGTTSDDELAAARSRLPASTRRVVIPGANHSQFGFYGRYPFDGTPTISHAHQIAQTVDILLTMLGRADSAPAVPRAGEDSAER
jgi:pimeloyl-ACP methyl ester carboxylesterase